MAGLGCGALFTRFGEGRNDWLYIRLSINYLFDHVAVLNLYVE